MSAPRPVLVVQHLAPEQPALVADVLAAAAIPFEVLRPDRGDAVPSSVDGWGGLVVLGGPMSARSEDGFPSRRAELALLRAALGAGRPTLGICLGAQLLAAAAGGTVEPGTGLEVGWAPIDLAPSAADDGLFSAVGTSSDRQITVLHWHGETLTLPPGAVHLASTPAYANQAFRVGAAWGLQFHLEVDAPAVDRFVQGFPDEADAAPGGRAQLLADTPAALAALDPIARLVLGRWVALTQPTGGRP